MLNAPPNCFQLPAEFSVFVASEWKDRLLTAFEQAPELHLDLSEVRDLDAAGLQVLISAREEAQQRGGHVALVNPSETVVSVLQMTGLADWVNRLRSEGEDS